MSLNKTNKKECPYCKSQKVIDTGSRMGQVQNYIPGKPIQEPDESIYKCILCNERFILVNYLVCPKCGSENLKKSGPFAHLKRQGEPTYSEPSPTFYHCWDCEWDWEKAI